jgi:hypothetical protein
VSNLRGRILARAVDFVQYAVEYRRHVWFVHGDSSW